MKPASETDQTPYHRSDGQSDPLWTPGSGQQVIEPDPGCSICHGSGWEPPVEVRDPLFPGPFTRQRMCRKCRKGPNAALAASKARADAARGTEIAKKRTRRT